MTHVPVHGSRDRQSIGLAQHAVSVYFQVVTVMINSQERPRAIQQGCSIAFCFFIPLYIIWLWGFVGLVTLDQRVVAKSTQCRMLHYVFFTYSLAGCYASLCSGCTPGGIAEAAIREVYI